MSIEYMEAHVNIIYHLYINCRITSHTLNTRKHLTPHLKPPHSINCMVVIIWKPQQQVGSIQNDLLLLYSKI